MQTEVEEHSSLISLICVIYDYTETLYCNTQTYCCAFYLLFDGFHSEELALCSSSASAIGWFSASGDLAFCGSFQGFHDMHAGVN